MNDEDPTKEKQPEVAEEKKADGAGPGKATIPDHLRDWGFDVSAFESRAKRSMSGVHSDLDEVSGVLKETLANTKQVLLDLYRQRGPVSGELKVGFERAWGAIEEAIGHARDRMKEAREGEPDKKADPPDTPA